MPSEDTDWDDDRDFEPDAPTFPIAVKLAGIVWIGFGALEWVAVLISLGQAGANGAPSAAPCCPGLVGLAFLVCGYQTVTGKAKDTLGNGIGSIALGLIQLAAGILIGVLGGTNNQKNDAAMAFVLAAVMGILGTGLIVAGALALSGRSAYRKWRRSQKPDRRRRDDDDDRRHRRRLSDDDDDDDDRRRRRLDDEDDERPRRQR